MRGKILKNRAVQYIIAFVACIAVVQFGGVIAKADGTDMKVEYRTYTAESGWLGWASDGGDCSTENKEVLTGMKMFISIAGNETASQEKQEAEANIQYSVYSKEADWSEAVTNGSKASTSDKPIKAITVEISGEATTNYNVEYRVLNTNNEWSKWCSNGEVAGNVGGEENIIGVQAKITQKVAETQTTTDTQQQTDQQNTTQQQTDNTANGNDALEVFVNKAVGEIGNKPDGNGVTKYGQWYQDNVDGSQKFNTAAWCAMFLSWCASDAGVSKSTVGYYAACSYWQEQFFVANGTWHAASGYTPARGDLIFFDYTGDGKANHNGIVESVSATQVVAIEGNVDKEVKRCTYEINDSTIVGYGKPDYSKNAENGAADKKAQEQAQQNSASQTTGSAASGQAEKIVQVALAEEGYTSPYGYYSKYGGWYQNNIDGSYNFKDAYWCAMFVTWCANQAGVSRDVIKPYAACSDGVSKFMSMGVWHASSSGYTPKKGDVIFFTYSHTGLVDYVSDGYVHTVEGNSSKSVRRRNYSLSYSSILGYGSPNYQ